MLRTVRVLLAAGLLLAASPLLAVGDDEKGEMANPFYQHWAKFKPGSLVTVREKTVLSGDSKDDNPDGIDEKVISYKLLTASKERVRVQAVVVETTFFGTVEQAPTRITYPATIKKSHFNALWQELGGKKGEETVKVLGKDMKVSTASGSQKKGDTEVDFKLWYTMDVPGGIVKRTRTTKQDGKVVAETTIEVESYKAAE